MKLALDILLALVGAVLFPQLLCLQTATVAGTFAPVLVFGVLAAVFHATHWQAFSWRRTVFSHLGGAFFAVLTAFGAVLGAEGTVPYDSWKLWLAVAFYTHAFAQALSLLWTWLEKQEEKLTVPPKNRAGRALEWALGRFYIVFPLLVLCWLPCWLATWPGNFIYDATKEFSQLEKGWMGDFPMLHSLITVKLLAWSFETTGGYNTGIALYTGAQIALLAAMFTHILCKLRALGANRWVSLAATVYLAAFPAVHVLVTAMLRDVLFAGLLTYSVFLLWLMCRDVKGFQGSWWKPVGPALVVVLTVFSRNNNTGLALPFVLSGIALVLFLVGGKRGWKGALVFGVTAVAAYAALSTVLTGICTPISQPSPNASMTVYTQSLIRAYTLEEENLSAGDKLAVLKFFNSKGMRYVAENGDSTKGRLKLETAEDRAEFMAFWRDMGRRYPAHYADAVLMNTRAAWFPGTVMDGYQKRNVSFYDGYEKCWFFYGNHIEEPGVLESKLPKLHDWYEDLCLQISFEKVPVIGLLFSVGFHFWLAWGCLFQAFYRKARHLYLPLLVLIGYAVASMCVPLMLLRYFAALIFAFPLVLAFILQPKLGADHNV